MIITIKLINTSIVSNSLCFFVVRTLKIYSISRLQVYKSSIINNSPHAVQHIPQDLFNLQFVPFVLCMYPTVLIFPTTQPLATTMPLCFYESAFLRIHISVVHFFVKVWILISEMITSLISCGV